MMKKQAAAYLLCAFLFAAVAGCVPNGTYTQKDAAESGVPATESSLQEDAGHDGEVDAQTPEGDSPSSSTATSLNFYGQRVMLLDGVEHTIIERSVVEIETAAFGTVDFTPTCYSDAGSRLAFFFEKGGEMVYRLPWAKINQYVFFEDVLYGFYYGDIDQDGLDDLIIIALCTGATYPSPLNAEFSVFFQRKDGFENSFAYDEFLESNVGWYITIPDYPSWFPDEAEMEHYRVTCDAILEFIHSQTVDLGEFFP